MSLSSNMYQILPAPAYFERLVQDIAGAQHSVTIVAHLLVHDDATHSLFPALEAAAQRGVAVTIVFDIFSRYYLTRGLLPYNPLRHPNAHNLAATLGALERLRGLGAQVTELGRIRRLNPYRGRCHSKFSVVDDVVYCFGGVNLYRPALRAADYMMRLVHAGLAAQLREVAAHLAAGGLRPDHRWQLDAQSELLVDHGSPGHSIIYDQVCQYAAQATRAYIVSQFYPSGRLAGLLRRTHTICYINQPSRAPWHIAVMLVADQLRTGLRSQYQRPQYLHAKFALFELPGGRRALVAGSHNYTWPGVAYGTQEIAIASTDELLWQQLYAYMQGYVDGPPPPGAPITPGEEA
jgi:cardiolipin synthase A/B